VASSTDNCLEYLEHPLRRCVAKYKPMKACSRELLEEEILRAFRLKVDCRSVDEHALEAVVSQWEPLGRVVKFDWAKDIMPRHRRSHPRGFDLAFWHGAELCGLACARLSDSKEWISLTYLEGSPNPTHALKRRLVPTVLVGLDIYATQVKKHCDRGVFPQLRIMNPLKNAMDWYRSNGYSRHMQANGYSYLLSDQGECDEQS
jgi:hypothetical protein